MRDEPQKSGIERAIEFAGKQVILADLLSNASGDRITQGYISQWLGKGYVPADRAALVSEVTGVPVADLIKQPRRRRTAHAR